MLKEFLCSTSCVSVRCCCCCSICHLSDRDRAKHAGDSFLMCIDRQSTTTDMSSGRVLTTEQAQLSLVATWMHDNPNGVPYKSIT